MRIAKVGSGGPPLVFVHGLACDATDWRAQVDSFKTRTTVVVCDLPGHGASPGTPTDCTIEAYGGALSRALRELALPPAILVGHSMGCRVVLEACRRAPPGVVAGLILVDGSRIGDGDPAAAEQAMADELTGDGYSRFMRQFFESMFVPSSDPILAHAIVQRALGFPAIIGRHLLTNLAGWDAREVESALDSVRVPLLAIQSTTMDTARERVSLEPGQGSPWTELVRAHVPQATVVTLPGAGHYPQIELAEKVTALIADFCKLPSSFASR
ncbi:alpha/beta fold hydrolase [Mycolicibacterium tusciae]|jgi:pimeloyl-ACP methyl ester carboxylesterase|uniref:Alpha/beta hydrolase n=1 Tax=Mycolicibacterium tusciae TaxID=75922 RepID=A0A1X0JQ67_9MYCO|nr:alpha/beta hydrolase [Mycolicibacterium tusciae]ORB64780.1 alpha/beta hydrolase [Mycolicibacterium tusciae]